MWPLVKSAEILIISPSGSEMAAARVDMLTGGVRGCGFDQNCRSSAIGATEEFLAGTRCRSAGKEDKMDWDFFIEFMGELGELVSHALLPNGLVKTSFDFYIAITGCAAAGIRARCAGVDRHGYHTVSHRDGITSGGNTYWMHAGKHYRGW